VNFGRYDHGWLHWKLGVRVADHGGRRSELPPRKAGEPSFGGRQLVTVTATPTAAAFVGRWRQNIRTDIRGDANHLLANLVAMGCHKLTAG
jgi:hypothetical protein